MKRKDQLRDIYQSNNHDFEKDFTPQVSKTIVAERERSLMRTRLVTLMFGGLAIVLFISLIAIVARNLIQQRTIAESAQIEDSAYIPRHSLSTEAAWVMNYNPKNVDESLDRHAPGEKPLSVKWLKYAAFHTVMGQQALAMDATTEAMEHFNKVIEIYPDIEGLHKTVGMLYIKEEKYELATKHLKQALEEEEEFDVLNNLGTAYIGIKKYDLAEQYLLQALELQSENPVCHKNLALLYRKMDQEKETMLHFEKYLELKPDDFETMQTYALYLTKQGRWEEAASFLTELTQEVTDVAPIYFLLAQVQVQNGKEDEAMIAIQRGIQLIDPSLALAWMSRNEFNSVREKQEFRLLMDQLEIASVSLNNED